MLDVSAQIALPNTEIMLRFANVNAVTVTINQALRVAMMVTDGLMTVAHPLARLSLVTHELQVVAL